MVVRSNYIKLINKLRYDFNSGADTRYLCACICDIFEQSEYPLESVSVYVEGFIDLHIRIPPVIPDFLKDKELLTEDDVLDRLKSSPSIERIDVEENYQNRGVFSMIVDNIGNLPSVKCVCVSNLIDPEFDEYFQGSLGWELLLIDEMFKQNSYYKKV